MTGATSPPRSKRRWSRDRLPQASWAWIVAVLLLGIAIGAMLTLTPPQPGERLPPSPATRQDLLRDYESFFVGSTLEGSGWGRCDTPITWSADVSGLPRAQRRPEILRLTGSMLTWTTESGLATRYVGRERLRYEPASHQLVPADGSPPARRHIYVSFLREGISPLLTGDVVGLAMPARVIVPTREVIGGVVILRAAFVKDGDVLYPRLLNGLDLHEVGHAMALGHATYVSNVMYPTIRPRTKLGLGDRKGARTFLRPCGTP